MGMTLKDGGGLPEQKALEAVKERIEHYGDRAQILPAEWQGKKIDILTAELTRFGEHLDTCLGEYFFMPVPGDPDGGKTFCAMITLRSDMPAENVPELAYALSILNFYIRTGCFVLNKPADLLAFRNSRTFPGDTPEETVVRDCVFLAGETYETAAQYCTPVYALAEGSLGLWDFLKHLKTATDPES